MPDFTTQNGQFLLDGQPVLIQAGEFHYYRTPQHQWRHRLGLLKDAGFNALASYIPWLWHQLEEGRSDFDGHSHPMRDLAGFLDLAAGMDLHIIARPGPYIMAETINEGIPPWVFSKYPQVAFISQDGRAQDIASYLHPDFLACISRWYQAIFEVLTPRQVTRGGKIIMIQLDNEMGMMKWVRNIMDTNPDTLSRFAAHLQQAHGERLWEKYPAGNLVDLLGEGLRDPKVPHAAQALEDYRRFYREYLREYAAFLLSEARACGLEVPPVINIHGFANGGKTFPIGLSQLVKVMELEGVVSATDVYPGFIGEGSFHQLLLVNEMTKALHNKEQPLFSVEFQAGGNQDFSNGQSSLADLHSRLCLSSGMRGINHYLFCDGENDPLLSPVKRHDWGHPVRKDGTLRRHYFRYPRLSRVLKAYGSDLVQSQPRSVTAIGFLLDQFMTEVTNDSTRESSKIITHQRDEILFDLVARGLALTHRPFRALDLEREALDPGRTPACWVMMEKQCSALTQQKLADYARLGGSLVLVGRMCVEDFDHAPCTLLQEALGIEGTRDGEPFRSVNLSIFGHPDIPVSFLQTYSGAFDQVFARTRDGETAGFIRRLGRGRVMVLGAAFTANTLEDLEVLDQMALEMDCQPLFRLTNWVDIRISEGGNGSFLFINNYQDDPVETTIKVEGRTLLGGNPVRLPARRGTILPLDWRVANGIILHYATAEVIEKVDEGSSLRLRVEQEEFDAELSLAGWRCEQPAGASPVTGAGRVRVHGTGGVIVLRKDG